MKTLLFFFVVFTLFTSEGCFALDLDDGIEIDDSIDVYHELGNFERNISFIVIKWRSRSSRAAAKNTKIEDSDRDSDSTGAEKSSGSKKVQGSTDELFAFYEDGDSSSGSSANTAAVNSIIIGAGSTIQGDIIIIDNSTGDHTAISK
ncbi:MAG: hypothetical protein D3903_17870 [Candidatus Electrothrix sp. GM3_4]|nr:hypothetical protein [Candidatus Electrothrix sp. GM3_4]